VHTLTKGETLKVFEVCWNLHYDHIRFVEDEWTLFTFIYINNKFKNHLIIHLDLVIRMYVQKKYYFTTFLLYIAIWDWHTNKHQYGMDLYCILRARCLGMFFV
jgi:hypothetical protein